MLFLERIEAVAARRGDEFYRRLARWPQGAVLSPMLRGGTWPASRRPLLAGLGADLPRLDPGRGRPGCGRSSLAEADAVAAASGMRSLRDLASYARAEVGVLDRRSGQCHRAHQGPPAGSVVSVVERRHPLSELRGASGRGRGRAALRGGRRRASACVLHPATHRGPTKGRHRLGLLHGHPSAADATFETCRRRCARRCGSPAVRRSTPDRHEWPSITLASGREPNLILGPSLAAVEAAATGDEDRWHDALAIAARPGPAADRRRRPRRPRRRRRASRELGGVPAAPRRRRPAPGRDRLPVALRLRAASRRRRHAPPLSTALGDAAAAADAEGRDLDWRDAAAYARRARGERKRPQPRLGQPHPDRAAGRRPRRRRASPTRRSPNASSWAERPSRPTSSTSSPSSASAPAPSSPPKPRGEHAPNRHLWNTPTGANVRCTGTAQIHLRYIRRLEASQRSRSSESVAVYQGLRGLAGEDSNLQPPDPKSGVLPLNYPPGCSTSRYRSPVARPG